MAQPAFSPMVAAARFVALRDLALFVSTKDGTVRWDNPREETGLDEASLDALGESVKEKLLDPLTVQQIEMPDGKIVELVVDGQRRVRSMTEAGTNPAQLVPVVDLYDKPIKLTEENVGQLYEDALKIGQHRKDLSSYELVKVAAKLLAVGRRQARIATIIDRSESWTSRMLAAWKRATPELKEAFRDGTVVTDEGFQEMAKIAHPSDQNEALTDWIAYRARGSKGAALSVVKETAAKATKAAAFGSQEDDDEDDSPVADPRQIDIWDIPAGPPSELKAKADARVAASPAPRVAKLEEVPNGAVVRGKVQLGCPACGVKLARHTKKGLAKCKKVLAAREAAAAKKAQRAAKPTPAQIGEFAKLRAERKGAKHAYVRGMIDFAAYVLGEIGERDLGAPWKQYLKQLHARSKKGK